MFHEYEERELYDIVYFLSFHFLSSGKDPLLTLASFAPDELRVGSRDERTKPLATPCCQPWASTST